jgi:protein gp37
MAKTGIEWTEDTWNPIVGCSIVSPGCTNCYAMKMAGRLEAMGSLPHYAGTTKPSKAGPVWTGKLALAPERTLLVPLRRRKPTTYFVNSMGDLFHEDVPDAWIDRVFAVMALTPQHTYQVLTKRPARMRAYLSRHRWHLWATIGRSIDARRWENLPDVIGRDCTPLPNVWLGVSAEDQARADQRIPDLLATPAAIRFVSAEPLLGPIDFTRIPMPQDEGRACSTLDGHEIAGMVGNCIGWIPPIDWIIVGGESGKGARAMHPDWARSIRDQCADAGTAFFFKQWGEHLPVGQTLPGHGRVFGGTAVRPGRMKLHYAGSSGSMEHAFAEHGAPVSAIGNDLTFQVGKPRAGRLLDGVEHNAMPEAQP